MSEKEKELGELNAFPFTQIAKQPGEIKTRAYLGLTKREYFAGLAMQGLLSNSYLSLSLENPKLYAPVAVKLADTLIAELSKEEE